MATLADFEEGLAPKIGKPALGLRPFVCEGSPLDCTVFIVGLNPATPRSTDFWDFWNTGYGFNKKKWFGAYSKVRQDKHKPDSSPTRNNIGSLVRKLKPAQVLETNVYAKEAERAKDLREEDKDTDPIAFLIEVIQPRVIVAHGKPAATYFQGKDTKAHVIAVPHFSLAWFDAAIHSLAQQVRCKLEA